MCQPGSFQETEAPSTKNRIMSLGRAGGVEECSHCQNPEWGGAGEIDISLSSCPLVSAGDSRGSDPPGSQRARQLMMQAIQVSLPGEKARQSRAGNGRGVASGKLSSVTTLQEQQTTTAEHSVYMLLRKPSLN